MISGIHHINLTVPPSTLSLAHTFYATTLGLTPIPVPHLQRDTLLWFGIGSSGQQVHIAVGKPSDFEAELSSRHPCFRVGSKEALRALQERVWKCFEAGGEGAPREADRPGEEGSGAKGIEYPTRFFVR
jgi:catechol 2,3-dioxygenase-like lactoylglutathione lyase family enzyme